MLATQWAGFHAARASGYLDELSETHRAFRVEGYAHPGWLLRFANWALSASVRLGPWIHVSSDATFLVPVRDGDELEVRAVVTDRFETKGHEFVNLRALYLVDRARWRWSITAPSGNPAPGVPTGPERGRYARSDANPTSGRVRAIRARRVAWRPARMKRGQSRVLRNWR